MTRANSSRRFARIFGFVRRFGNGKISVRHFFNGKSVRILPRGNVTKRNLDVFGDKGGYFLQNRLKECSKIVKTFLFLASRGYVSRYYNLYENRYSDPSHYDFEVTVSRYIYKKG